MKYAMTMAQALHFMDSTTAKKKTQWKKTNQQKPKPNQKPKPIKT